MLVTKVTITLSTVHPQSQACVAEFYLEKIVHVVERRIWVFLPVASAAQGPVCSSLEPKISINGDCQAAKIHDLACYYGLCYPVVMLV